MNFEFFARVQGIEVYRSCDENVAYSFLDQNIGIDKKRKVIDYLFNEGMIEGLYSVIL
jgi:hypothetical protein